MSIRPYLWMSVLLIRATAGAAQPHSALKECHDSSAHRTEVGRCLDHNFAEANAELSDTVNAVRKQMKKLDEVTARPQATRAFDRAAQLRVEGDALVLDNDEQTIVLTFGHSGAGNVAFQEFVSFFAVYPVVHGGFLESDVL